MAEWIRILHLSDLHRSPPPKGKKPSWFRKYQAQVKSNALARSLIRDIETQYRHDWEIIPIEDYELARPDLIVVTGDLVWGAESEGEVRRQYRETSALLGLLAKQFLQNKRDRILIVPGNHDVHWPWSHSDGPRKLELFAEFYNDFYSGTGASRFDPKRPYTIARFPKYPLAFLCMSSLHGNDVDNPDAAGIAPKLWNAAVKDLASHSSEDVFRIALWHHSISVEEVSGRDYVHPQYIPGFTNAGVRLVLHGHIHRSRTRITHTDQPQREVLVHGTGSFCAAYEDRPDAVPVQYSMLAICPDRSEVLVYPRRRELQSGGEWAADRELGPVQVYRCTHSNVSRLHTLAPTLPVAARRVLSSLEGLDSSSRRGRVCAKQLNDICNEAYQTKHIHDLFRDLLGSDLLGVYVHVSIGQHKYISIMRSKKNGPLYIDQALGDGSPGEDALIEDANTACDTPRLGHWFIDNAFDPDYPPLSILLHHDIEPSSPWTHFCDQLEFQRPQFTHDVTHHPLVYAYRWPARHSQLQKESFGEVVRPVLNCVKNTCKSVKELKDHLWNHADSVRELHKDNPDHYLGKRIKETVMLPIPLNPRINITLMPVDGYVPRNLGTFLALRKGAQVFHQELAERIKTIRAGK